MPFQLGNRFANGGIKPLGRRRLKKALEKALGEDGMDALAERVIEWANDDDPKISLKAIELIRDEIDGKPAPRREEGEGSNLQAMADQFFGALAQIAPASEHQLKAIGIYGPERGEASHLAVEGRPDEL